MVALPPPDDPLLRRPEGQIAVAVVVLLLLGMLVLATSGEEAPPSAALGGAAPDATATEEVPVTEASPAPASDHTSAPASEVPPAPASEASPVPAPVAGGSARLGPGDCFDATEGDVTAPAIQPLDCAGPHDNEVYLVVAVPDAAFPGHTALRQRGSELCRGAAFEDYVGVPWGNSRFFTFAVVPSEASWTAGDRLIVCALYDIRGPREGSALGSGL